MSIINDFLKPFFIGDHSFSSLILLKQQLNNLPVNDGKKVKKQLKKLLNFINVDDDYNFVLPTDHQNKITIDTFNDILILRGLINENNVDNEKAISLIKSSDRNFRDQTFLVDPCRFLALDKKMNQVQYSQYLQKDCHQDFISTCDVKKQFLHPICIYNHFINIPNFSFMSYCEDINDPKINFNHSISWIIKLFLYGSINDCKIEGKTSDYIDNFIYFLEKGIEINDPVFLVMVQSSTELYHYLYDHLFSEYCKKEYSKRLIETFEFVDFLIKDPKFIHLYKNNPEFGQGFRNKFPYPYETVRYLLKENDFSISDIYEFSKQFKPIPEIEEAILPCEEWRRRHIDELANQNIYDLIRSKLFHQNNDLNDQFGEYLLNAKVSLLSRQVYILFKACQTGDKDIIQKEIDILMHLINPWNNDDRVFKFYMNNFINTKNTFDSLESFNSRIKESCGSLNQMMNRCKPFYVVDTEDRVDDIDVIRTYVVYEKIDIRSFLIERLLLQNATFLLASDTKEELYYPKIFDFFINLPFVHKTEDLYILASFANEIVDLFRDQLNLTYLYLSTCENCTDLLNEKRFPLIKKVNETFDSNGYLSSLQRALQSADDYGHGLNASEKLKAYVNRLIEINNKTILERKYHPFRSHFRLILKRNVHSNMSLSNTIVPALSHLDQSTLDSQRLIDAFYLLTKANEKDKATSKIIIDMRSTMNSLLPIVFNFKSSETFNFARTIFTFITPIPDSQDFLEFNKEKVLSSLYGELKDHLKSHPDSYRTQIWKLIKKVDPSSKTADGGNALNALLPLFEVFDDENMEEHHFFNLNELPEKVDGIEAASFFLRYYMLPSLFDTIDE